ncbi:MAG: hypothetical protein HY763_04175 [Planctomycetes bacterium]|nr:hypothetical protein [Planctomycetota bacterium]
MMLHLPTLAALVGAAALLLSAAPAAAAPPHGHGVHPPMPSQEFFLRCRLEGAADAAAVEAPVALSLPTAEAKLDQQVVPPKPFPPFKLTEYLPSAELRQQAVADDAGKRPPLAELAIEGPTQSFRRWLAADDPERNRLISFIATWRFMSVLGREARDDLFRQFGEELTREPMLVVSRADGSDPRTAKATSESATELTDLGCTVRTLQFFPHYAREGEAGTPVNRSQKRLNPAAWVEIQAQGKSEKRWVFAKFPDFQVSAADSLPFRVNLDCPVEAERPVPHFAVVSVAGESLEVWTRHDASCTSRPAAVDERVEVPGSQYRFFVATFVRSGRLVEEYKALDSGRGVPALRLESPEAGPEERVVWLELNRPRVVSNGDARMSLLFSARQQAAPGKHP